MDLENRDQVVCVILNRVGLEPLDLDGDRAAIGRAAGEDDFLRPRFRLKRGHYLMTNVADFLAITICAWAISAEAVLCARSAKVDSADSEGDHARRLRS